MTWISVKDDLPKDQEIVLVWSGYDNGHIGTGHIEPGTHNAWAIQGHMKAWYQSFTYVTHWMPLPDPPLPETNDDNSLD